jgi:hypothetical protein
MIPDILKRFAKISQFALLMLLMGATLSGCGGGDGADSNSNPSSNTKISYIKITNEGSSEVGFNAVISGKSFYTKEDEIITEINGLPSDYANEPFYRKLWRYLIKNRYHFDPYTGETWGHSPVLYLNSIGFGFCDDVSALYYALATRVGYEVRVWGLWGPNYDSGHVVPEVWIKDHWEMYDPDMEVYYWNEKGQVAGVEEVCYNPQLITQPINPFPVTHFSPLVVTSDVPPMPFAYTQFVADIYSNINYHGLQSIYYEQVDFPKFDHPFSLPPKAYLEFPVKVDHKLKSDSGADVPTYDLMRLVLPKGWSGSVKLPFAFFSISGSGRISLNNTVYDLDSTDIDNQLIIDGYIYQASIIDSSTNIEIVFLVNKTRFDLNNISSFEIKSNDSKMLTVVYN